MENVVWWLQIYPVQEWWTRQGKKRGGWSDAPIMRWTYRTRLWGQCCDLGLLQLDRSGFSNITCPKNEVSSLPEYIEGPGFYISGFFSSLMAWAYSKMTTPWLRLWKGGSGSMRLHFRTGIGDHRAQTLTTSGTFGMCWRRLYVAARLSHHQYKSLAKNESNSQRKLILCHCKSLSQQSPQKYSI